MQTFNESEVQALFDVLAIGLGEIGTEQLVKTLTGWSADLKVDGVNQPEVPVLIERMTTAYSNLTGSQLEL